MRRFNDIEASWNRDIDITDQTAAELGRKGEEAVINFFKGLSPRVEVRHATPKEDAGSDAVFNPKTIDAVIYVDGEPAIAPQISVSRNPKIRREKLERFKNRPYIRLEEQRPTDVAVPTGIIFPDQEDVEKRRPIDKQVLKDTLNSLRFVLALTKNPKEIEKVQKNLAFFEQLKFEREQNKKGKTN